MQSTQDFKNITRQQSASEVIPVVMMADLIAEGDHEGWTALTKVAIPVT
jgi:hypothetical protein